MRDLPSKAPGIEIYNAGHYLQTRRYYNGYGLLLHEYCHVLHQFVLPNGLDNAMIQLLYQKAVKFKRQYQSVYRRDWIFRGIHEEQRIGAATSTAAEIITSSLSSTPTTLLSSSLPTEQDMAYALVNPYEYFAELSVAYLCDGYQYLDIPPNNGVTTVQDAHKKQDSMNCCSAEHPSRLGFEKFCPPLLLDAHLRDNRCETHNVRIKRWDTTPEKGCTWWSCVRSLTCWFLQRLKDLTRIKDSVLFPPVPLKGFVERPWHCGKFYPFTKHQLRAFDLETYKVLETLWKHIEDWEDEMLSVLYSGSR